MEAVVYGGLVMVDVQYCPTSCPHLTENGCTIAVGNAKLACPAEDECLRLAMFMSDGEDKEKTQN